MSLTIDRNGLILLPVSPDELATLIRSNVRAELDSRFPAEETERDSLPEGSDDLLTVKQTTQLLHVSRVTLFEWERQGTLIPCRIGRRVLYRKADVEAALKRGRVSR